MNTAISLGQRTLLPALGALLVSSLLVSPASSQSLCSSRNGSGANPAGYACVNDPLIGTNWNTTVDIATPGAAASAVSVFLGGPLPGIPTAYGELLCNFPLRSTDVATGFHAIPIPNFVHLLGETVSTQAAAIFVAPLQIQFQNAIDITIGALGNEDITVLVLEADGNDSTPPTLLSGATVTLRGTDPSSVNGITQTTGAGGTTTFTGVAGPYSVTAQADFVVLGTTTRVGASLIDVVPTVSGTPLAGTIGVLMTTDFEDYPGADATLSGTVSNLPTLSGNEYVEVVATANGHQVNYEFHAFVDPGTGNYSMPIPSNTPIDCYLTHRADFSLPTSPILASLLQPGVGQTGSGTILTKNFDFGLPAVVPWNVPVSFSATNVHPALDLSIQLVVQDLAAGIDFDFSFFDGSPPPSSITLPDPTHASFSGYQTLIDADTFDPLGNLEAGQDCNEVVTATPASVAFDFFGLPSIQQPANLAILTLAQLNSLTVQTTEGSTGAFGTNGINIFVLGTEAGASGPPPPGIDQTEWAIFTRAGVTSFDMPPYSLPMFGSTQSLFCGFEQLRFAGYAVDYDAFFSATLGTNFPALIAAMTEQCASNVGIGIFLTP